MRKVNIPEFRKEVVAIIQANRDKVTSFEAEDDYSIFTFCGTMYACEVTLNDKWIGYDLGIEVPKGFMSCGRQEDTDIYPIYGGKNEEIALEIYDDLLQTIRAIFNGEVYYATTPEYEYTARKNKDGTYSTSYMKRKRFLFWRYATGWRNDELPEIEFRKLDTKVLS